MRGLWNTFASINSGLEPYRLLSSHIEFKSVYTALCAIKCFHYYNPVHTEETLQDSCYFHGKAESSSPNSKRHSSDRPQVRNKLYSHRFFSRTVVSWNILPRGCFHGRCNRNVFMSRVNVIFPTYLYRVNISKK